MQKPRSNLVGRAKDKLKGEKMDLESAIKAASEAGYKVSEEMFFADNPRLRREGILLRPGELVFSTDGFIRFVEDGFKNPHKYSIVEAFRAALSRDICECLNDLYEAQQRFIEPVPADTANTRVWSTEDLATYERQGREIALLQQELIKIERLREGATAKDLQG